MSNLFCFFCFPLLPVSTNKLIQSERRLYVTNPIILSWHSYCCGAFLSKQSLLVSGMENSAQEKKNNAGFILTNICNKMKIFSQLYWNLLRHLVIAAWWRLLRRELKGPDKTREGGLCILFIQGLSPESVRHSVLWAELKCWNSNIKTLLLLHLLNPAISTLILARAVEDVMSVLKLNTKQRLYCLSSTSRHGQEQGVCCHRRHV